MSALSDLYTVPQEHLDFRDTIREIAQERIAPRAAAIDEKAEYPHLMIQELGTLPIKLFGSEELKDRFLPRCASGEWSPAFALSEPEAGSDPGGMITRAVQDGDEWVTPCRCSAATATSRSTRWSG
jgi:alkylation response protein AidB-like acyl-CoA dehydrogenase